MKEHQLRCLKDLISGIPNIGNGPQTSIFIKNIFIILMLDRRNRAPTPPTLLVGRRGLK